MRILLGADGSNFARIAEELILRVPTWKSAEIVCASVYPSMPLYFASAPSAGPNASASDAAGAGDAFESAKRLAEDDANAAVDRFKQAGFNASPALLEGDPGIELLEFAERNGIDLIAVGSRGMGAFESLLLGSAARRLVAHAPCHVLVGRPFRGRSPEETLTALRTDSKLAIAVGVDGSEGSKVAMEFVKAQGNMAFDRIVAICAEPLSVIPAGIDPAGFTDLYHYDHERAAAIAERSANELAASAASVKAETELGRPSSAIGKTAERNGVELILAGATRHGTLERFLIGSVSYELATEAPCSVLILRPAKA
jgi:nucleotide-binding universal stress UspA family protein